MSGKDRRRYLTETVLDQEFLDWSHDNLECRLEAICEIETPTGTIYASDRNKYVGSTFYEALLVFPVIGRTVGEWLAPELQFSTLQVELSNADERFNSILPGGASYDSWIGKSVTVKIGLAESAASYTTIFQGKITDIGGAKRSVKSITLIARDKNDQLSVAFPSTTLNKDTYPDLESNLVGTILPVIYGDYTTALGSEPAIVPSYVTNGADPLVLAISFDNVQLRISENALSSFDTSNVYLRRSDVYYQVPSGEVANVSVDNNTFEIVQDSTSWVDGGKYFYAEGDVFYVRVTGKDLGSYDDNIVAQAKDILQTYTAITSGEFDANWTTFRDKASPVQSAISTIKSRVWIQEPTPVIQYVLSMLEQVRLEAFIDRNQKIKLNALHFEEFDATPPFTMTNWDVVQGSFAPQLDERNNFNRAQGAYDFHPDRNENAFTTSIYKNQDAINQIDKAISKRIVFPNLYVETDVVYQITEILRLASATFETVDVQTTWRSLLQDIGNFVSIDIKIGSTYFDAVPGMIRNIGYDPNGMKIVMRLWSFMMCPFPGYTPGYSGTKGGYAATITKET